MPVVNNKEENKNISDSRINYFLLVCVLGVLLIFVFGCSQKAGNKIFQCKDGLMVDDFSKCPEEQQETGAIKSEEGAIKSEPEIIGPNNCKSVEECLSYCSSRAFECSAWCNLNSDNKEVCAKFSVPAVVSGIPGSPCMVDNDCISPLICVGYKCNAPTPDNLAKKSGFGLPGGCTSMQDCAVYCAKPENYNACMNFCSNFPSLCSEQTLSQAKASAAPAECKPCLGCNSKDCILDCTYKCYAYMTVEASNINALKSGVSFEREYQEPIKAVWEPGPAYNRIGITYFIDDYKELGVNTYSITPKYSRDNNKLVHTVDHATGEKADNEKIANIIQAKKAGFQVVLVAHDLYDMFPDANKNEELDPAVYVDQVEATSLKWARIAEDYKVEYFVPINEFEYILYENGYSAEKACEITNAMYKRVIPKVKGVFSGKIYCRVGGMDSKFGCMDFSQCDIFGFTYGFSSKSYKSNFDSEFVIGEQLYEKYQKQYVMAEAFALLIRGTTLDDCRNLHRAGIESYKENAKHGIGYTFMGLVQRDPINKNDCRITEANVVDEYKEFFKWLGNNK